MLTEFSRSKIKPENPRYISHSPFHPPDAQRKLASARVLVAGCGAGSPIVIALAQLGVGEKQYSGKITIADPDKVEEKNLSRQAYGQPDIGLRKVDALARRVHEINSGIDVLAVTSGVTDRNVESLVKGKDVVVDMVDVSRPDISLSIHDQARKHMVPVVTGLDVGFTGIGMAFGPDGMSARELLGLPGIDELPISRIRELRLNPLAISAQYLLGPLNRVLASEQEIKNYYESLLWERNDEIKSVLPLEMHEPLDRLMDGSLKFLPQSGLAGGILASILTSMISNIILGQKVRFAPDQVRIDLNSEISPKKLTA